MERECAIKQKFKRGEIVKVADKMPPCMEHFETGFIGVVEYTYAQQYGGDDIKSYSLIMLDDNKKPIDSIAWYKENQLTIVSEDTERGEKLIEEFNRRGFNN